MSVDNDGDKPAAEDGADGGEDRILKLAQRQEVLDYVSDIAGELSVLLDRHDLKGLADDLRGIALRALKAKYEGPDDTGPN